MTNALTVKQYLHNKNKRTNGLYISKEKVTVIDGKKYTDEELKQHFPIHPPILTGENLRLLKGANIDKTKLGK